jgi:hypothetical protein|tara:strand:- start:1344 stop:2162 length:819 start_codon:yes stop_codon:yes gene_type:complete
MKKFKRLYTNGSSVTHGWPLCHSRYFDSYGEFYGIKPWKVVGGEEQLDSRININWPSRLAETMGVELIDESRGGGSSMRAMRMCMEYINKNLDSIDDTLFIIETTSGFRDEIYSNRLDRLFNVVTSNCIDPKDCTDDINDRAKIKEELESYFKYFVNENHHYNKEANYFIGFFSLLKQMGCEFFIINQAIKGHTEKHYKQIYETLGVNDKIVKWDDTDCMVHWYWKEKKLHIGNDLEKHNGDTDYHPGYFGHIEIAKKLHKWIVEYYKPKLI